MTLPGSCFTAASKLVRAYLGFPLKMLTWPLSMSSHASLHPASPSLHWNSKQCQADDQRDQATLSFMMLLSSIRRVGSTGSILELGVFGRGIVDFRGFLHQKGARIGGVVGDGLRGRTGRYFGFLLAA